MQTVIVQDLGVLDYAQAWEYQTTLHRDLIACKLRLRDRPDPSYQPDHRLLFVEHPHVFTLGKSGSAEHLLLSEAELKERGVSYYPINRGGDITYHGPGQLVGYPILDLDYFFNDIHRYVRYVEETVIRTLADYGIRGERLQGYTGVWVSDGHGAWGKVCAIGVHLSRWVTLHGFAFNVNTDLRYFDFIVPCGIADRDKYVVSIQRLLGRPLPLAEVRDGLSAHFAEVFGCRLITQKEAQAS